MTSQRLHSFRSDVRRAIAARRRLLASIFAAAAVVTAISAARPPPPPTTPVVVATRDLPTGSVLGADDLDTVDWPRDSVPVGVLHAPPLGSTVTGPVRTGEPLTDVRLIQPSLLAGYPPGSVLTTVRIADPASASVVHPGDVVDLVGADPQGQAPAAVVAHGVRIVAAPQVAPDAMTVSEGFVLVIVVDEPTALRLADAAVRLQLGVLLT